MLILTRKHKQSIVIHTSDGPITVHILSIDADGYAAKVGIEAPREVPVYRKELYDAKVEAGEI